MTGRSTTSALPPKGSPPDSPTEPSTREQRPWGWLGRAVVALFGIAVFSWYQSGRVILGIDTLFSLNPDASLVTATQSWSTVGSPGLPNSQLAGLPVYFLQVALRSVGIGIELAELITLAIFAIVAGLGVYSLFLLVAKHQQIVAPSWSLHFGAVGASLIWLVSPFALAQVWYRPTFLDALWAVLPWLTWACLRAVVDPHVAPHHTFATTAAIALAGSAGLTEAYLPGVAILLLAWLSPPLIQRWRTHDHASVARAVSAGLGLVLGTLWWLLPALPFLTTIAAGTSVSPPAIAELEAFSPYLSTGKLIALMGAPFLWQRVAIQGARFEAWSGWITGGIASGLPYLVPLTALGGIVLLPRRSKSRAGLVAGAIFALIIGILVAKGLNPPFPQLAIALTRLPFGSAFRDPATTLAFVPVLPLTVLFGFGVLLTVSMSFPWRLFSIVGGIGGLLFGSLIWFTGNVLPASIGQIPSTYVAIPRSYTRVAKWLTGVTPGTKIMVLPYSQFGQTALRWQHGADTGPDCIFPSVAPRLISLCGNVGNATADLPGQNLARQAARNADDAFALGWLWGVGVWLIHRDWDFSVAPATYSGQLGVRRMLAAASAYSPPTQFHSQQLVALREPALPLVYAGDAVLRTGPAVSPSLAARLFRRKIPTVVVGKTRPSPSCGSSPTSLVTEGSPAAPRGRLVGDGTVCLVFAETFSPGWQLVVNGGHSAVLSHFVANWWENGWSLRVHGDTRWSLRFSPARGPRIGLVVGLAEWVVLFICLVALTLRSVRKRARLWRAFRRRHSEVRLRNEGCR